MATMFGSLGISASSLIEQDFSEMRNKFTSLSIEICQPNKQLPSGGSTSRLTHHHVSEMLEPLSAGHRVFEVLTYLTSIVKVFTPMAHSDSIISQQWKQAL